MKKLLISVFTILVAAILAAGGFFGFRFVQRYLPTKEAADVSAWFDVSGDEVAIVLDNELIEEKGIFRNSTVYFPLTWVTETLNEKFYWDTSAEQLVYTLPNSIVYADLSTTGNGGATLLLKENGTVYLQAGVVTTYTDIRLETYVESEVKRIFVDTKWEAYDTAMLKKNEAVRELGGVKSPVLTQAAEAASVFVLESMDTWTQVRTEDGFLGYVRTKRLEDIREELPVSQFDAPVYTSISLDEPITMVWHQVMSAEANAGFDSMIQKTKGVNVVAPTWFMLTDNSGNFSSFAEHSYVEKVHGMGAQLWAVVDNFNQGENVQSEVLFANMESRKHLISGLIAEVQEYNIDGINLDIESIKPEAGPHYVQFIRELSVECRNNGIILSVDSYVPSAYTSFYNRPEQGRVADYVVIMAYDEHYAGGEKGSVSSLTYVNYGIERTMEEVPAEKIICGIPFYTRLWIEEDGKEGTTSKAMGIANAKQWVQDNDVNLYWQEEPGQYYGELTEGKTHYYIWLEEEESIKLKKEVIEQNNLAGLACWKLGFEPESIWEVIHP